MPEYLPPLAGVSLSEAEAEAAAIAPAGRVMLDCLEFWAPGFTEPARIVTDKRDFNGRIEAGAPRNAGEMVLWMAVPVSVVWPREGESSGPYAAQLQLDGVSAILAEQLDLVNGSLDPLECILRRYASDDPSGPSRLPVSRMELSNVQVSETRVTATIVGRERGNRRWPAVAYTRARYPGLPAR